MKISLKYLPKCSTLDFNNKISLLPQRCAYASRSISTSLIKSLFIKNVNMRHSVSGCNYCKTMFKSNFIYTNELYKNGAKMPYFLTWIHKTRWKFQNLSSQFSRQCFSIKSLLYNGNPLNSSHDSAQSLTAQFLTSHIVGAPHFVGALHELSALVSTPFIGTQRSFHTSSVCQKKYKKRKPIVYSEKSKSKLIEVWKNMTVQDLAKVMDKSLDEIFEIFLYIDGAGVFDRPNMAIGDITVLMKAAKLAGMRVCFRAPDKTPEEKEMLSREKDIQRKPPPPVHELQPRPPIVTIMGHVDHGKTTLLDSLRHSSIVESEFGGITQHIGAFEVSLPSGEQVTFLDTPGHAAFSAMRVRGASITDLVTLVVAADDGVAPQTQESINIALETGTPMVVAINKIDKKESDIERCKRMLLNAGVQLEEQGGEVQAVEISALKGTNMEALVEALVAQAEVLNLRSTRVGLVEAVVVEAQMDPLRGKVATCIVQRGTLTKGAVLIANETWAKVRGLFNCNGKPIDRALPGTPVQVLGWRDQVPCAGDDVIEVDSERRAKEVLAFRAKTKKEAKGEIDHEAALEKLQDHLKEYKEQLKKKRELGIRRKMYRGRPPLEKQFKDDPTPRFSFVLKGDVNGSIEVLLDVLETYHSNEDCRLDVISYSLGDITPGDIDIAKTFGGHIYSFNAPLSEKMKQECRRAGVSVRHFNVIYRLIEDLKAELAEKMPQKPQEEIVGEAVVQQEFLVTEFRKKIPIAGCVCTKGQLKKEHAFKVYRGEELLHEGQILSLRHLKKEVDSIRKDVECGIRFTTPDLRFRPGDTLVCFRVNMVRDEVDWHPAGFD